MRYQFVYTFKTSVHFFVHDSSNNNDKNSEHKEHAHWQPTKTGSLDEDR